MTTLGNTSKVLPGDWKKTDSNQRAKFYRITALGKKQLASYYERWGRLVATIKGIMTARRRTGGLGGQCWHGNLIQQVIA